MTRVESISAGVRVSQKISKFVMSFMMDNPKCLTNTQWFDLATNELMSHEHLIARKRSRSVRPIVE